ncbi:MAG: SpoIIIAH-like family protein [Oscillospiraceae bacterium]|nr:SpoIIIAH-like family protein [Oscillospiraceae bacterium]
MKNAKSRRQLTMVTLVVALGVAVYLNWEYAKNDPNLIAEAGTPVAASQSGELVSSQPGTATEPGVLASAADAGEDAQETSGNKNYGDAQLVSAGAEGSMQYFEKAELSRQKNRDEALDRLQKALKNAKLSEEEKQKITDELSAVLGGITLEGDIENMVKAKGFANCLASIDAEKVNLAVATGGDALTAAQVSQLRDIVLSKIDTEAKNITIVEVK